MIFWDFISCTVSEFKVNFRFFLIFILVSFPVSRVLIDNTDENDTTTPVHPATENDSVPVTEATPTTTTTKSDQSSSEEEQEPSQEDPVQPEEVPDFCEGNFDAMGIISNQLFIIKSSYVWKFDSKFKIFENFPQKLSQVFPNLPRRFTKIDAFYENYETEEIVIFCGDEYITYDRRGPIYMAYNLTRFTNDPDIEKIDAAMVWGELRDIFEKKIGLKFSEIKKSVFIVEKLKIFKSHPNIH